MELVRTIMNMKNHRFDIAVVVLLLIVALVPRLADLGVFLTADEKNWIGRSYEFVRAFKDWRFNDMLQTTHPGVTTLWLSGGAVTAKLLLSQIPFSFQNLFHFVKAAQFPIALVNALLVPVMYLFLRKLFPRQLFLPVLATLLIALDPFLVGYSRLVHVDALLAGLLFLAALATMLYAQRGYARRWLIISATFAGLAVLTKAPAIFIIPFFWLVVLGRERLRLFQRPILKERVRDFVLWGLIAGLLFLLLWPAMLWVPNQQGNVLVLKRDLGRAAITPHHMAEDYTLEGSHYLYALLTRTTPVTLVFAAVAVFALVLWLLGDRIFASLIPRPPMADSPPTPTPQKLVPSESLWLLIAYIFFFVLMMTLGAKKGDRYILAVWPALDVLAAFGVVLVAGWFGAARRKAAGFALAVLVIGYLGVVVARYHPYAIAYSNPLFPDNLSQELGWGEGLEQVGAWLSEHDPQAVVASWYPEELGAYTSAQVAHINAHEQPRVHYVVLYRNMFGRAADHPANDFIDLYYRQQEPVFVAHVFGKEFAWVFEKETYERVVGELVAGVRVGQEVEAIGSDVQALEILPATYSGRAVSGQLVVEAREALAGPVLQRWRVPVSQLKDNVWLELALPDELVLPESLFIEIRAEGTSLGDAPTVRYSNDYDYRSSRMLLRTVAGQLTENDTKEGDLAIRLR